jgi:hypothetical protein
MMIIYPTKHSTSIITFKTSLYWYRCIDISNITQIFFAIDRVNDVHFIPKEI